MIQIQHQCSHRNTPSGWKASALRRAGHSAHISFNQYGQFLRQELESGTEVFDFARRARIWLSNHLILLSERSNSDIVFVSELFSSEEVSELAVWPDKMPSSLIRHHVAMGKALPASNPAAILRGVQRDPLLSSVLGSGQWINTWTEIDEIGISHLMYALSWEKKMGEMAVAA